MKFREDGTFHILHITDIQEIPEVAEDTLTLMRRALDAAKPDLVVFTGDQLKGYSKKFRKKPGQVEKTINRIMEPVVSRGIPFAVTFGNHDEQSGMTNDEQMEIYRNIPGCVDWLNSRGQEILHGTEEGTFAVGIRNFEETQTVMAVYLMDSRGDAPGGGYQTLNPRQVFWYKGARDTFEQEHGRLIPGIVFQHIPMPEYYRLLKKTDKKTKGAVRTYRTHANEYYVLDPEKYRSGSFKEAVSIPDNNAREFESFREKGDILQYTAVMITGTALWETAAAWIWAIRRHVVSMNTATVLTGRPGSLFSMKRILPHMKQGCLPIKIWLEGSLPVPFGISRTATSLRRKRRLWQK